MHAASEAPAGIAFGRYLLLPYRRELLADGRPVRLGGRAFDVLMTLIALTIYVLLARHLNGALL